MEGGGFEPPKLSRQIYSLIPLATREPLRKAAYSPEDQRLCQHKKTEKSLRVSIASISVFAYYGAPQSLA